MLERVAWYSIYVNVFLTLLNLAVLLASGSLAVAAEMIHNLVDLLAAIVVLIGLKLSKRRSRDFPYGLYKVENLVSVGIAFLIFFAGYEIARLALFGGESNAVVDFWILGGVILSMAVPLAFSMYEMRVARTHNSPSLRADAEEYRVHFYSSGIVFAALIGQWAGFPFDRIAAVVVVLIVARTGWKLISDGMRVLLDASLDPETLGKARAAIEAHPAVIRINALTGRNAGRYRFLEAEVSLRLNDLEKAHLVSHAIEEVIRTKIPHVERVLVHIEPYRKPVQRVAVALDDQEGRVSKGFGTACYFAFSDMQISDGVEEQRIIALNPHRDDVEQRGINVARWLLGEGADVVICGESISDKAPGYLLLDAGIRTMATDSSNLESALERWQDIFHDGHPPSGAGVESRAPKAPTDTTP